MERRVSERYRSGSTIAANEFNKFKSYNSKNYDDSKNIIIPDPLGQESCRLVNSEAIVCEKVEIYCNWNYYCNCRVNSANSHCAALIV